jgi:hypothetical protein
MLYARRFVSAGLLGVWGLWAVGFGAGLLHLLFAHTLLCHPHSNWVPQLGSYNRQCRVPDGASNGVTSQAGRQQITSQSHRGQRIVRRGVALPRWRGCWALTGAERPHGVWSWRCWLLGACGALWCRTWAGGLLWRGGARAEPRIAWCGCLSCRGTQAGAGGAVCGVFPWADNFLRARAGWRAAGPLLAWQQRAWGEGVVGSSAVPACACHSLLLHGRYVTFLSLQAVGSIALLARSGLGWARLLLGGMGGRARGGCCAVAGRASAACIISIAVPASGLIVPFSAQVLVGRSGGRQMAQGRGFFDRGWSRAGVILCGACRWHNSSGAGGRVAVVALLQLVACAAAGWAGLWLCVAAPCLLYALLLLLVPAGAGCRQSCWFSASHAPPVPVGVPASALGGCGRFFPVRTPGGLGGWLAACPCVEISSLRVAAH